MNDPHVESVEYAVDVGPDFEYTRNATPAVWETDLFSATLEGGILICRPKVHFSNAEEAKLALEPHLTAWVVWTGLTYNTTRRLSFNCSRVNIIDRAPPEGLVIIAGVGEMGIKGEAVRIQVTSQKYPEPPPTSFQYDEHVEALWTLYAQHLEGRWPLLPMAFACLSYLTYLAGSRQEAARMLNVSENLLERLGKFTSIRGEIGAARKFEKGWTRTPLTPDETEWVERTLRVLIQRLGNPQRHQERQITLADLAS